MIKQGIVIKLKGKTAYLLTPTGEFAKVKVRGDKPHIGQLYEGNSFKDHKIFKLILLLSLFFICATINVYYTPKNSIIIDLNFCIKLEVNKFNKIINTVSLNENGSKILKNLDLKNLNIDSGLISILQKSKEENIINDKFIKENKVITIYITNSSESLNLDKVKNYVIDNKLKLEINNNGKLIIVNK